MEKNIRPPKRPSSYAYVLIIALIITGVLLFYPGSNANSTEVPLNTVVENARSGNIKEIQVAGNKISLELVDGTKQYSFKESGTSIYEVLRQSGVSESVVSSLPINVTDSEGGKFWTDLLLSLVPFLLIVGFFVFMMRSAQSSNNQAMSFGKSKAKQYDKGKQKTTFEDVAGVDEAKNELEEVVDFLKNPKKYSQMGAKIPKGVILVGPPGTGKTLLARAVAGEADVPFFSISGSEFVEMFVGVGASRVRDLFNKAKRNAPCLIFIDEIDAVGRHRGAGMGGGHDEREQTLNQILSEMDGFEKDTTVIVIAATNRPDILDPALLRPGRFDRRVVVDLPDVKARESILKVHARNKPMEESVELDKIARGTPGFSGADIENLLNEAAILTAKRNKKRIGENEIESSIEKIYMGPERKTKVLSPKEKKIVAYHEVGHAIIGHLLPGCDPIQKVSVISRGMALGVTWSRPTEDRNLTSKSQFLDEICMALGGYTTEEFFFNEMTNGASSDLKRVKEIATAMVTKYGMSKLGPVIFGNEQKEVFLGKDLGHVKDYSENSASEIDKIITDIIQGSYQKTRDLIAKNKDLIEKIAGDLMKKETLSKEEFEAYFTGKKAEPKKEQTPKTPKKKK
ncbi:MAG: ATP-dependent zinc metalloprotease FtsH [Candidatus Gracilibacteria bacterium]|jgi:cell division protease FtsH|nr:ATP-dependent zinc metalloprotease FtsH [Candidatus Gracilibacteria bacterium]